MLLVIAAVLCVVSVPLAGGKLSRLAQLEVRATWAVIAAAAIQVVITSAVRGGSHELHTALHAASYALVAWFLVVNRRVPGLKVLATGVALNALVIVVNGGVMPASRFALRVSGLDTSGGFANSTALSHPHLQFLGDVIPVPGPWPIGNVLSVGDLLIFAGALLVLHRACGRGRARDADPAWAGDTGL
jgi:hypothetical protein